MFHVVAELYDARVFNLDVLNQLEPILRNYDPSMLAREPGPRPAEVELLSVGDFGVGDPDAFVSKLDALKVLPTATGIGEWHVLAESSLIRSLDWSLATEVRESLASSDSIRSDGSTEPPTVYHAYYREYVHLKPRVNEAVVIRNRGEQFSSPGQDWLAFNPELGRRLGWSISPNGLFRWQDSDGVAMVETMWWAYGGFQRQPPHLRDQVGNGWLVLATSAGLRCITSLLGPLNRHVRIERSARRDGNERRNERLLIQAIEHD